MRFKMWHTQIHTHAHVHTHTSVQIKLSCVALWLHTFIIHDLFSEMQNMHQICTSPFPACWTACLLTGEQGYEWGCVWMFMHEYVRIAKLWVSFCQNLQNIKPHSVTNSKKWRSRPKSGAQMRMSLLVWASHWINQQQKGRAFEKPI